MGGFRFFGVFGVPFDVDGFVVAEGEAFFGELLAGVETDSGFWM